MSEPRPSALRPGLVVVAAAVSINLILGALYAWGVIAKALVVQWQWTRTQASLPFTVSTATFAIMMIFAGRAQDRLGPRRVAMAGGLLFGLALVASSFVTTPAAMLVTFGVIGGIGIGLGYSSTTPPSIKWFPPARKGIVTGVVVSGVGLAAVYVSPLTQYLLKAHGIPRTFLILGIAAMVLIILLSRLLRNPPAGYVAAPAPAASSAAAPPRPRPDLDWPEMVRTPAFAKLWLMFVLTASAGLMMIAHVALIAKTQAKWEWGFVPVATLAIFNTLGRLVSGVVSDRIGRTRTMVLAFAIQAVNMFVFRHYTTPGLLVFGSALTGFCYGAIFTLMPAATADFYGVRHLGVNYGLVFSAFGVAGVVGPILAARIFDATKSYALSFTISGVMLVAGAILALTTRPPRPAAAAAGG